MKNVVKLEHYYYPWELEQAIAQWVEHYNHHRYHESLNNVTPADVSSGGISRSLHVVTRSKEKRWLDAKSRTLGLEWYNFKTVS